VVIVIHIMIMVIIMAIAATTLGRLELFSSLPCDFALFSMPLHGVAQSGLCFVNIPVTPVISTRGQRCPHQPDNREQCDTKNSDNASHAISLNDCVEFEVALLAGYTGPAAMGVGCHPATIRCTSQVRGVQAPWRERNAAKMAPAEVMGLSTAPCRSA
jgi:hypothetical protein